MIKSGQTRSTPLLSVLDGKLRVSFCPSLREARMDDNGASGNTNGLPSGWRVEIGGDCPFPQGAYSMIELDADVCLRAAGRPVL